MMSFLSALNLHDTISWTVYQYSFRHFSKHSDSWNGWLKVVRERTASKAIVSKEVLG